MRTRRALVTMVPALLAVVCMQSSNTQAQDNTESQLSAAVNAAAPLTYQLSTESTEAQMAETRAYWTSERLANAQPMLPTVNQNAVTPEAAPQGSGTSVSLPGKRPTVTSDADSATQLYDPAQTRIQPEAGDIESQAIGSFGAPYTSARVNPPALETHPLFRPTGKLFFFDPRPFPVGGNKFCSASVLRHRIVLTAGHCVHRGSLGTAGFHARFLFVPAFRLGAAPLGTFTPRRVGTTFQWATGGGGVPNAADFGMFEMNDRGVVRIGIITGFYGFQTLALIPNHTTKLGYPGNLDSGQRMQQNTSQSFRRTNPNNVEYGSNYRGGSSGGPWLMNFGSHPVGAPVPPPALRNVIVGVTSYLYISFLPQVIGSSIPDSRAGGFIPLLNLMCSLRAGNCS